MLIVVTPPDTIAQSLDSLFHSLPITNSVSSSVDSAYIWLIVVIATNIIVTGLKWLYDYRLKLKDVEISRKTIIEEKRIDCEAKLFNKISDLFAVLQQPDGDFVKKLNKAIDYRNDNFLYISDDIKKLSDNIFDYLMTLQENFDRKNIDEEEHYKDEYVRHFYG